MRCGCGYTVRLPRSLIRSLTVLLPRFPSPRHFQEVRMAVLRRLIGDALRRERLAQQRTLREVSGAARGSLGYLSEVERGQKEASSELLASICQALDLPLGELLHKVAADVSALDNVEVAPVDERIGDGAPREKVPERGAKASAAGIEGGSLMSELIGNDLADQRVSPAPRMNP